MSSPVIINNPLYLYAVKSLNMKKMIDDKLHRFAECVRLSLRAYGNPRKLRFELKCHIDEKRVWTNIDKRVWNHTKCNICISALNLIPVIQSRFAGYVLLFGACTSASALYSYDEQSDFYLFPRSCFVYHGAIFPSKF